MLGVEEHEDKSLHPVNLPDPEGMVRDFWNTINNQSKVSVNILTDKNIQIHTVDGNCIIEIVVPKAKRTEKPVYIDNNLLTGSYRRNGEGDYHCTQEEVHAMVRDAAVMSQDMKVLEGMDLNAFDYDSIHRYRNRMKNHRPGHVWEELEDNDFLYRLGAVGRGEDGKLHPTAAGLLMFGYEYEIVKEFPYYFLDYQEKLDEGTRWTDRIASNSGDWSGNVYDFYFRVYQRIVQDIKVPFKMQNGERVDDTPVHNAFREALANCMINADYYGSRGLVIVRSKDTVTISNPGGFRIDIREAKSGGVSDPRNSTLIKMFNLINIGERSGRGIPLIYDVWKKEGWQEPVISQGIEPDRITLELSFKKPLIKTADKKPLIKTADKKLSAKTLAQREAVIDYLTIHVSAKNTELAELLDLKPTRIREIMKGLIEDGVVVTEGDNKSRVYRLKA